MKYSYLGRTGLHVSQLALGTAAFGLENYGIHEPGEQGRLSEDQAIRLVRAAVDKGINFFDTARGYGESEAVLGRGLNDCPSCIIATKVGIAEATTGRAALTRAVMDSVETSLKALHRDVLDIVQIHNATQDILERGEILDVLEHAREAGKLKFVGASVYGEPAALAAVRSGRVDVLQIALNLLDQRMLTTVLPEAKKNNVGIVARSAFLKGSTHRPGQVASGRAAQPLRGFRPDAGSSRSDMGLAAPRCASILSFYSRSPLRLGWIAKPSGAGGCNRFRRGGAARQCRSAEDGFAKVER